jgi:hypothetical protein
MPFDVKIMEKFIDLTDEDAPFILAIETHQMTVFHFLCKYDSHITERCNRHIRSKFILDINQPYYV